MASAIQRQPCQGSIYEFVGKERTEKAYSLH